MKALMAPTVMAQMTRGSRGAWKTCQKMTLSLATVMTS